MADEYSNPPQNREINIAEKYRWENLTSNIGAELLTDVCVVTNIN